MCSDEFSRWYSDLVTGSYDCMDRIVINAFFPQPMMNGGYPPRKSRKPLILTVVGSLVAVIAVVSGVVIAMAGGGKSGTLADAVRGYPGSAGAQ